jgi:hypothetical protein
MTKFLAALIVMLMPMLALSKKPTAAEVRAREIVDAEARRMAASIPQEQIRARASEIAEARAGRLAWITAPSRGGKFLNLHLYMAHGWQTRSSADIPSTSLLYGVGAAVSIAAFDLSARVGGATLTPRLDRPAAILDVSAGARWWLLGVVGIYAGWYTNIHSIRLGMDEKTGTDLSKTRDEHGAELRLSGAFLGAIAEGWCRMSSFPRGLADSNFSALCGVGLTTPPILGF